MSYLDGMSLLFGDTEPEIIPAQAPHPYGMNRNTYGLPSPAPPPRRPAPVAPAPTPAPAQKPIDGNELLFGTPPAAAPAPEVTSRLARQRRPGDARQAIKDYIEGRTDPRYAGVRGFSHEDMATAANPDLDASALSRAQALAPSDAAYHDIIRTQLGPAYVRTETDSHGQQIVVFRDNAGAEHKRYVNQPGLDWTDVTRAITGAVPYMVGGAMAGAGLRGAGLGANVLGQTAAAGGTAVAANAASRTMGSDQPLDLLHTGLIAAGGGLGAALARPIGAAQRRWIEVPGMVDQTGTLTARGAEIARRAGLDPATVQGQVAREFAEVYAMTRNASEAAARGSTVEFGLPATRGQFTKDPQQLLVEKGYRQGLYGHQAREVIQDADARQVAALHSAAVGGAPAVPGQQQIAPMLAPHRGVADIGAETLGPAIRGGVQGAREEARAAARTNWNLAGDATASPEALASLPGSIQSSLGGFRVNPKLHPTAAAMGDELKGFMAGRMPAGAAPEIFGAGTAAPRVDEFRKQLYRLMKGAAPGADRTAAAQVYGAFDKWMVESAERGMLTGANPQFAVQNRIARDVTKDIEGTFAPMADGKKLPAANILSKVMRPGTSAEEVIATLFGASGQKSAPKEGAVQALENLKKALHTWGDGKGGARSSSWDDVRLAYWTRLAMDKRGNVQSPQNMLNNLQNAFATQGSVLRTLYSPEELSTMTRFAQALRHITWKDPNPSGTATAAAGYTRELATTLMRAIGWQGGGPLGLLAAGALTPIRNVMGSAGARAASRPRGPAVIDPNVGPVGSSAVQGLTRTDLGGREDY